MSYWCDRIRVSRRPLCPTSWPPPPTMEVTNIFEIARLSELATAIFATATIHVARNNGHYSTFFGATVLKEVLDICPYSSLLVVATKKRGIMAICWASLSRISNIHSKLEKKPREKHSVASPPRVFHSVFSLVCRWIFVNTASRITAYCPNFTHLYSILSLSSSLQISNMHYQAKMERWPLTKSIEA